MNLYRKKPVVIRASQWFKHGDHPAVRHPDAPELVAEGFGWCPTLEGGHIVTPGDWIITGVAGEHYPCKPSIFAETYESAAAPPEPVAPEQIRLTRDTDGLCIVSIDIDGHWRDVIRDSGDVISHYVTLGDAMQALIPSRDELVAELADANETIANLVRALREETEPPTFMGEPVTTPPRAWKMKPLEPTPGMIDAGAQRLVSWGEESKWPDSWLPLQVAAARNEAERVWRSMWLTVATPEPATSHQPSNVNQTGQSKPVLSAIGDTTPPQGAASSPEKS